LTQHTEPSPYADIAVLDCFVAQHRRPESAQEVHFASLSSYHRCLLLADGTVTRIVEAHTLERTHTRCLAETYTQPTPEYVTWLELTDSDDILVRRVAIEGSSSGVPFLYATSAIVPSRLPDRFLSLIGTVGGSVGAALLASDVESRRELLWYGRRADTVASRGYRIFVRGVPALVISEDFVH
jgi:chorismate-pyruvate lyase